LGENRVEWKANTAKSPVLVPGKEIN